MQDRSSGRADVKTDECSTSTCSDPKPTEDSQIVARAGDSAQTVEAQNLYDAMNMNPGQDEDGEGEDDVREAVIRKVWDRMERSEEHLLFGLSDPSQAHPPFRPEPAQVLKLWQVYLDDVDPLLKVTHTPSLQPHILDAIHSLTEVDDLLYGLLLSICCIACASMTKDSCLIRLGSSKYDLLSRYRESCREVLVRSQLLRATERASLTALFLYLLSVKQDVDPRSLSSTLGIVLRIAQRMGIDSEIANARCDTFEGEMRRRLWWAIVHFDARISELAHHRSSSLAPTWDCRIPSNLNDFEVRPGMAGRLPDHTGTATQAVFIATMADFADAVRHSDEFISFTNPLLKPIAHGKRRKDLEDVISGDAFLSECDMEVPINLFTALFSKEMTAKHRLLRHHATALKNAGALTEEQRDEGLAHAIIMLQTDIELVTSPKLQGFAWYINMYLPFPAYIQIIQDLKRRPLAKPAEQCWHVMNEHYKVRFNNDSHAASAFFDIVGRFVLPAWEARRKALAEQGRIEGPPPIVAKFEHQMASKALVMVDDAGLGVAFDLPGAADFDGIPWPIFDDADLETMLGGWISDEHLNTT